MTSASHTTQVGDASEATLSPMTEQDMAGRRRSQGVHVLLHKGRFWEETRPGFYQPIHWLARLSAEEATRPARLCWGYRSLLGKDSEVAANGSMAVHVLSDVESYDLQHLSSPRRWHLRKCRKLVQIVAVTGPALLQEQGYDVVRSALTRKAYARVPSRERYLAGLASQTPRGGRQLILAGLIGARLGGYLAGFAVGATAYIHEVQIATEALTTDIGSGLVFDFVQACRRSGAIREVVYGQHAREDPALDTFKDGMGFPVRHIPTKVYMHRVIGAFIRWRRPHAYYRLTGHD